jgi:hypothetical protein
LSSGSLGEGGVTDIPNRLCEGGQTPLYEESGYLFLNGIFRVPPSGGIITALWTKHDS